MHKNRSILETKLRRATELLTTRKAAFENVSPLAHTPSPTCLLLDTSREECEQEMSKACWQKSDWFLLYSHSHLDTGEYYVIYDAGRCSQTTEMNLY